VAKKISISLVLPATLGLTAADQLKSGALGLTTSLLDSPNLGMACAASKNTRLSATIGFQHNKG
jgi:hypothetical protein